MRGSSLGRNGIGAEIGSRFPVFPGCSARNRRVRNLQRKSASVVALRQVSFDFGGAKFSELSCDDFALSPAERVVTDDSGIFSGAGSVFRSIGRRASPPKLPKSELQEVYPSG